MYNCQRFYNSGDRRICNLVRSEDVIEWAMYNIRYRPGCCLVICGYVIEKTGYSNAVDHAMRYNGLHISTT